VDGGASAQPARRARDVAARAVRGRACTLRSDAQGPHRSTSRTTRRGIRSRGILAARRRGPPAARRGRAAAARRRGPNPDGVPSRKRSSPGPSIPQRHGQQQRPQQQPRTKPASPSRRAGRPTTAATAACAARSTTSSRRGRPGRSADIIDATACGPGALTARPCGANGR